MLDDSVTGSYIDRVSSLIYWLQILYSWSVLCFGSNGAELSLASCFCNSCSGTLDFISLIGNLSGKMYDEKRQPYQFHKQLGLWIDTTA